MQKVSKVLETLLTVSTHAFLRLDQMHFFKGALAIPYFLGPFNWLFISILLRVESIRVIGQLARQHLQWGTDQLFLSIESPISPKSNVLHLLTNYLNLHLLQSLAGARQWINLH
jgi:hypothetical protein